MQDYLVNSPSGDIYIWAVRLAYQARKPYKRNSKATNSDGSVIYEHLSKSIIFNALPNNNEDAVKDGGKIVNQ